MKQNKQYCSVSQKKWARIQSRKIRK